ncbi:MAG TPA: hypothetical protein VKU19_14805 [Bryobacteraceae bacterium]|nr:hypothetical protein [Bryobacteraceae bacterium]
MVISDAELKVRRNKLEKLKLKQEATQVGDYFRERRRREADEESARQQLEHREREEQQRQVAAQQAAQRRQEWRDEWIYYAERERPFDAPESVEIDIVNEVERVLEALDPSRDNQVVERLVDAAIERALQPWTRNKEKSEAIDMVLFRAEIDCSMMEEPEWKGRAQEAAGRAIESLRQGASRSEMERAGDAAVQSIVKECQHRKKIRTMTDRASWGLDSPTSEERDDAKDAVREALEALPIGASDRQFEQAREAALASIRVRITTRRDDEMRAAVLSDLDYSLLWGISDELKRAARAELQQAMDAMPQGTPRAQLEQARDSIVARVKKAHELRQHKERLIDDGLREIYRYIQRLEKDYDFDKSAYSLDLEIRVPIRKALWEEVTGKETAEHVAGIVRRLVSEELEIDR